MLMSVLISCIVYLVVIVIPQQSQNNKVFPPSNISLGLVLSFQYGDPTMWIRPPSVSVFRRLWDYYGHREGCDLDQLAALTNWFYPALMSPSAVLFILL